MVLVTSIMFYLGVWCSHEAREERTVAQPHITDVISQADITQQSRRRNTLSFTDSFREKGGTEEVRERNKNREGERVRDGEGQVEREGEDEVKFYIPFPLNMKR